MVPRPLTGRCSSFVSRTLCSRIQCGGDLGGTGNHGNGNNNGGGGNPRGRPRVFYGDDDDENSRNNKSRGNGNGGHSHDKIRALSACTIAAPMLLMDLAGYYMEWETESAGNMLFKLIKLVGCFVAPPVAVCIGRGRGPDGKWWRFDRYTWITLALNFIAPFAAMPLLGPSGQTFGVVLAQVHALNVVLLGLRYGLEGDEDRLQLVTEGS
mmetsp:Transcript_15757/g.39977  ORF Transcript_15757/g.39977 Transcript_15757/m.39977 type:complete len:210 (-) Transcript_15757:1531-2160(-)